MAAAVTLLAAGGIVAATSTADAHSGDRGGRGSAVGQLVVNSNNDRGGDSDGKRNGRKERGKK
ncbi:MAG TPA: hypothetical protein VNA67_04385, partial [Pseudonocardiaceae bacterium]|nr:hypothetical protein [Pseudonocardiaceae bacterium]